MTLRGRQKAILEIIRRYFRATGEPCPGAFLARKLDLHHSTVQTHLIELYRKGLLRSPNSPATPARRAVDSAKVAVSDPAKLADPPTLRRSDEP